MDFENSRDAGRDMRRGRHVAPAAAGQERGRGTADSGRGPGLGGDLIAVRELGRGASAVVWLARSARDGRLLAVKCFNSNAGPDPISVRRELRLASHRHEHLLVVHDVLPIDLPEGGTLGLVMDYAAGGSLGQLVRSRGRLTVGETVTVLTPLAQVLSYLHHQGAVHGDLAPGNVLFTSQGKPLLSDLGVARMVGDPSADVAGTPGFMDAAPALQGEASLHPGSDIYSLAALGWFCLTGVPPGTAEQRPPLPLLVSGAPAGLATLLEAGLNPDPAARPTASEFATAVFRCAAAEPIDLSASVHPSVIPELLTKRREVYPRASRVQRWRRSREILRAGHLWWNKVGSGFPARPVPGLRGKQPEALPPDGQLPLHAQRRRGWIGTTGPIVRAVLAGLLTTGILIGGMALASGWLLSGQHSVTSHELEDPPPPQPGEEAFPVPTGASSIDTPSPVHSPGAAPAEAEQGKTKGEGVTVPAGLDSRLRSRDPVEAVHALAELRSLALQRGSADLLARVTVPGSPAAESDGRLGAALETGGRVLSGFSMKITTAELRQGASDKSATVRVMSSSSAYEERLKSGRQVGTGHAAEGGLLDLVLARHSDSWRITDIRTPT